MQRFAILTSLLLFPAAGCTHEGSALLADTWSVGPGLSETGDVYDGLADDGGQLGETGEAQDDDEFGAVDPPSEPLPPFADYAACEIDGTVAAYCNSHDPMVLSCTAIWASDCEEQGGNIIDATPAQMAGSWPCNDNSPLLVACTDQFKADCEDDLNGTFDCIHMVGDNCVEGACNWPTAG